MAALFDRTIALLLTFPLILFGKEGIKERLGPDPFVLSQEKVAEIVDACDIEVEELLRELVPIAKEHARAPVSGYQVGGAALGKSGAIYLGVNVEFPGMPLNTTVHCEQFLIVNAKRSGESEIVAVALSAPPCGHCRQFISEIGDTSSLQILLPKNRSVLFSSLLPSSFGPTDLGLQGNLLTPIVGRPLESSSITDRALDAALRSYAPYTQGQSGVAIRMKEGKIYSGSYLENAAFNPTLSPLQTAVVELVADGGVFSDISEVVLAEEKGIKVSQAPITKEILRNLVPGIELQLVE